MGGAEARVLLDAVGVRLRDTDHGQLIERTEGWPVGLYLAALAIKAGGPEETAGLRFSGDDRPMADYLGSELLSRLSEDEVSFLTRTSVLERMCGPLCDAVLGANDSGEVLRSLEGSNLLLVALDQRAEWYRYHHLLRDLRVPSCGGVSQTSCHGSTLARLPGMRPTAFPSWPSTTPRRPVTPTGSRGWW